METVKSIQKITDEYFNWLRDKTVIRNLNGGWDEITTPFLDRHNDCLQIYVKREKNSFVLTDDGYIISDLRLSGCDIDSPKRKSLLQELLSGYGVKCNNSRLETTSNQSDFPTRKHNLVQAMLAVNDMFYLAAPHVASLFTDDISSWFESLNIRYTPNIIFTGKSGFSHHFFGVIPKSKNQPERIVQPVNNPDRNSIQKVIFEWNDTKELRRIDSILYPILNDIEKTTRQEITSAFASYGIQCISWSLRENFKDLLAS
jgi:hypothetical protein